MAAHAWKTSDATNSTNLYVLTVVYNKRGNVLGLYHDPFSRCICITAYRRFPSSPTEKPMKIMARVFLLPSQQPQSTVGNSEHWRQHGISPTGLIHSLPTTEIHNDRSASRPTILWAHNVRIWRKLACFWHFSSFFCCQFGSFNVALSYTCVYI